MSEHESIDVPAEVATALEDNPEAVAETIETITRLQESGTLDDLAGLADMVSLLTAATDDEMAMKLSGTAGRLGEIADTAADDDVARGLESTLAALGEATAEEPREIGLLGLVRAMRDPEVRAGMDFLVQVAGALGRERQAAGAD